MDVYQAIKALVGAFAAPLPVFLGLAGLGLGLAALGRRRLGWGLATLALVCLLLAGTRPVADAVIGPLEGRHAALLDPASVEAVAAVVVLGGGWAPNADWPITGQLNEGSAIRLMEGVRIWRALPQARLILSGASRFPGFPPVAQGYAEAALALGVPKERILTLETPVDTAQEAVATRAVLGPRARLVLVTSAAHMARAMAHFQRVGLDPVAAPTQQRAGRGAAHPLYAWIPSAQELRKLESAWHEYLGLLAMQWDH